MVSFSLHSVVHYAGYAAAFLAAITGAHITTARRWKRKGAGPPEAKLLRILLDGDLGEVDPAWKGWTLRAGALIGPDGLQFKPGEVLALPFFRMQIRALETRNKFDLQADWIEQRYVPPVTYEAAEASVSALKTPTRAAPPPTPGVGSAAWLRGRRRG